MSNRTILRRRGIVAAVFPAMLALAACGTTIEGSASAGDVPPIAADGVSYDQVALKEEFKETPQEVEDYWQKRDLTGNKAQEFGPNDTSGPKDEATGAIRPPTAGGTLLEPGSGLGEVSDAKPFPMTGLAGSTTGQLFFMMGADAYRCSATVINSESQDLLLTAAHCLYDTTGQNQQVSNVLFVPGATDNSGNGPYGQWFAKEMYIPPQFTDSARSTATGARGDGWSYDFAFLRVEPRDGQKIQQVTGGQGIGFGIPTQSLVAVGYPAESPFDGSTALYCATASRSLSAATGYTIDCTMNGGASGGGWLARYDKDTGAGYVVAASSTAAREPGHAAEWIQAMPLGKVAYDTFVNAGGTS